MKYPALIPVRYLNRRLQQAALKNYYKVLLELCRSLPYDWARTIHGAIRARDVRSLIVSADLIASQKYEAAAEHFAANQLAALIRKYPFPDGVNPFSPKERAYTKFLEAEHKCHRVNQKLIARRRCRLVNEDLFARMRSFISYVIGYEVPLAEIWSECGFGPGASIGVHGSATNFSRKLLASRWTVSPSALHYAFAAVTSHAQMREILAPQHRGFSAGYPNADWNIFFAKVDLVQHNKIVFVPKTAKTERSIAVEPLLNGFLQKGVDIAMRKRLRRIGIDLEKQEPNQEMARLGSLSDDDNSFVTIDLASASDSISLELCRELLPPEWFAFLDATRSKSYAYEGKFIPFKKFCSMGNGFCFPLETLLFAAACHAVGAGRPGIDFRVYGDDIVVRKKFFEPVVLLLEYIGFAVNTEKTFSSGPFRESCGADWFGGEDVRPFTLDFALDSVEGVFKFLNLTLRSTRTIAFFEPVRAQLLGLLPVSYHFFRPYKGPENTGITSLGSEHLLSTNCVFNKRTRSWVWREFHISSVVDNFYFTFYGEHGETVLVFGALCGSASASPFTLRNITKTKVRLVSHPGATSSWLPADGPLNTARRSQSYTAHAV